MAVLLVLAVINYRDHEYVSKISIGNPMGTSTGNTTLGSWEWECTVGNGREWDRKDISVHLHSELNTANLLSVSRLQCPLPRS